MKRFTAITMVLTMGLLILVSCKKDKDNNANTVVFHATIESRSQDRTYFDPDLAHNKDDVKWLAGDRIKIANGNGESAIFALQSGENDTTGTFTYAGEFETNPPFTAVYPETATIDGTTATFNLPATQTINRTGTCANGANPMAAYGTDDNLMFKNLCGALDIRLKGYNVHVSGIRITADESEKLNGTFVVDCSADEPVLIKQGTNGTNTITLNCDVTLFSTVTPQDFFIILPEGTLARGFTMEVLDGTNVICTKELETSIAQIVHNKVKRFNPLQIGETPPSVGLINSAFTINSNGNKVNFSQGNLQYQAYTNTWRFAENQYDYVGNAELGNVYANGVKCNNAKISYTYTGWIDLFGWGTSGWPSGGTNYYYQPWDSDGSNYRYGPSGQYDLTGSYANSDWGVYNPISNGGNMPHLWRTLTQPEWDYVINTRSTTSGIRYAKANVNNVNGLILLPDDWSSSTYSLSNTNSGSASFSSNTLTASQWSTLEQAGAVFLPAAGFRIDRINLLNVDESGDYWSASCKGSDLAYIVRFYDYYNLSDLLTDYSHSRRMGRSVRLVRDAE